MSLCVTLKSWTCGPCASLPIGMSIHVKKAKADRPAETFQEAAYLVFSFSLQEPLFRESFLRLRFHTGLYVPGGPCCHTFCCLSPFPTRSLLGCHSLSFPLAAVGSWASWVHGQRCHHLLWPPSGSKHWSGGFMSSPALSRVTKSHLWNQCVCQQADTYGKQMLTVESPEVLA